MSRHVTLLHYLQKLPLVNITIVSSVKASVAYQGIRNVSFGENFAYVLNE